MCVSAIIWAGVKEVYYCSTAEDAHKYGFGDRHIRDYLTGKDKSVLNMVNMPKREDCDTLFAHYRNLQSLD